MVAVGLPRSEELRGAPRARDITEAQAETILNKVLDAGINYIDTSIDYGLSEERIGRYISHPAR
jgi:aryl-alcohol dehydrogenase-like predicted oxidoreductase